LTFTALHSYSDNGLCFIVPTEYREALKSLSEKSKARHGGYLTIKVDTPRKPRTTGEGSQNRHLNGHVQQIATETGNSFEDVKKYCKQIAVSMGYPMLTDEYGEVIYDLWGEIQGQSEKDCSTREAAILIEATHMVAGGLGISLRESWE
jgi:hypothetical protein